VTPAALLPASREARDLVGSLALGLKSTFGPEGRLKSKESLLGALPRVGVEEEAEVVAGVGAGPAVGAAGEVEVEEEDVGRRPERPEEVLDGSDMSSMSEMIGGVFGFEDISTIYEVESLWRQRGSLDVI